MTVEQEKRLKNYLEDKYLGMEPPRYFDVYKFCLEIEYQMNNQKKLGFFWEELYDYVAKWLNNYIFPLEKLTKYSIIKDKNI